LLQAARAAGIAADSLAWEACRILTREQVLYIVGRDTATGEHTPGGGSSHGTRNGVSAFLEDYLSVRWLLPGEHGDYVPRRPTVNLPAIERTDAPFFRNRRLPYTGRRRPDVRQWWARQKLGVELVLSHGHNWRTIPASAFDEHPDWFAEKGGQRVPPSGHYKLCLSSTEMFDVFAEAAIKYFDQSPQRTTFSLSPSDCGGWCACDACAARYEKDPNGRQSVTPAVLHFYNEIARRVAVKHPDRVLCGYVYASYVFPPQEPIRLQPNLFLVWAPSFDYGFTLFRPALQRQWDTLAAQWTAVTENIAYYDLPNCVANTAGAPNPPGLKILKFLYPRLKRHRMKGVYVYGHRAWGHAAPMNYLLAKLAWDPDADVDMLFDDFCEKAYGKGAGQMKQFYRLLDDATERYFIENENEWYRLSNGRLKDVYAANFGEMERLVRGAEAKITDPDARARLDMLSMNLTILHWSLRQFNFLEAPELSSYYLDDAAFFATAMPNADSLAISPTGRHKAELPEGRLDVGRPATVPNAEAPKPFLFRG